MKCLLFVQVLLLAGGASGATPAPPPVKTTEPATTVERFTAQHGRLLIKTFRDVGKLPGFHGDSLEAETLCLASPGPANVEKVLGLRLRRPPFEQYESEAVAFLDYDECISLKQALAYMSNMSKETPKDASTEEVNYVTRGGTIFGFFISPDATPLAFVTLGGPLGGKTVYLGLNYLPDLVALVDKSIGLLQAMGAK